MASHGMAQHGMAWHGMAWHGMLYCCGRAWHGLHVCIIIAVIAHMLSLDPVFQRDLRLCYPHPYHSGHPALHGPTDGGTAASGHGSPGFQLVLSLSLAPFIQGALRSTAQQMAGLLPQDLRGVAADALSAAAGEGVTLEGMEAEAAAWELMQGSFGGVGMEPEPQYGAEDDVTRGAAGPVSEHPAGISGSVSVSKQVALPSASPHLSSRHLAAALSHVKARTATEVGAPQVGRQAVQG